MSYPGNPSLAADVQGRILEAYRHSLDSAANGNRQEALLGCDFILRLDPQFAPARTMQQMLDQNRPPESFRELLGQAAAPAPSKAFTAAAPGLVTTFTRLLEARRFEELLGAAQAQSAAVSGDPKLAELVAAAQSRFEAEPLVRQLLDSARRAVGAGKLDQVAGLLDNVRELDATHPGLAEIERLRSSAASLQTSLKIDWDEDEGAAAVPPPADLQSPGDLFSEPDLPPLAAPVAPPAFVDPAPFRIEEPQFAAPEAPRGAAPEIAPAEPPLELPEIDFSLTAPSSGFEPDFGGGPGAPAEGEEGDGDSTARVQALLDEGEAAFGRGEYQGAIDAWSRIFLIDIDNGEAARRIERARQLKAEREREVEEVFHGGVARFDAGDLAAAREAFLKVLEVQPSYVLAREYLEKIEEREAGAAAPLGLPEIAPAFPAAKPADSAGGEGLGARGRGEVILVPPEPGAKSEARKPAIDGFAVRSKRSSMPSPVFLAVGGAVLAALAVGGWLLASNWERLFPNASPETPATPAAPGPIAQAKKLQGEGKTAVAIAQLRRIPPQDAAYAEAQSLISQWEKLAAPPPAAIPDGRAEERRDLLDRAGAAYAGGENLLAQRLFARAAAIAPLDGPAAVQAASAEERLAGYQEELSLLRDGEYEMALNRLWRRHDADPSDRDTRRLMVDAYYNLSLSDLQRGAPQDARQKLKEARALDRDDPMLERLERFCAAYERRPPDLLYRIFVKYLPTR